MYIYTHTHTLSETILTTLKNILNTLTWESQEHGFSKNKSNATSTKFSQQILGGKLLLIIIWAQY